MATKIFFIRPCPIWNIMIRAETVLEMEDWLASDLIKRGVAENYEARQTRIAERKAKKAEGVKPEEKPRRIKKGA